MVGRQAPKVPSRPTTDDISISDGPCSSNDENKDPNIESSTSSSSSSSSSGSENEETIKNNVSENTSESDPEVKKKTRKRKAAPESWKENHAKKNEKQWKDLCFMYVKVVERANTALQGSPQTQSIAKITIESINLKVPHLTPNDDIKLQLLTRIKADESMMIPFRRWELHELPALTQGSTIEIWSVKTCSALDSPRYVIVFFQTKKADNLHEDVTLFDNANIKSIRLALNSDYYPQERMLLDFSRDQYADAHFNYTEFNKSYHNCQEKRSLVNFAEFKSRPMFVIDCSRRHLGLKSSTVDINILDKKYLLLERNARKNKILVFGLNVDTENHLLTHTVQKLNTTLGTKISEADINNIYSLGKKENSPVKIEFTAYLTKKSIIDNVHKLKGTNISVVNDMCEEDRADYRILRSHMKEARAKNLTATIRGLKLLVNGEAYSAEQLREKNPELVEQKLVYRPESSSAPSTPTIDKRKQLNTEEVAKVADQGEQLGENSSINQRSKKKNPNTEKVLVARNTSQERTTRQNSITTLRK
ncbi:unnamed protein product [Phaedon cochleariae]|uniref:Double jelly roll-like domain-containing protein n=1 Tax=Phaedon cochleariae TaxID=80249 RepID=A0A9N9SF10_PHACE|nr:unnamed protein product [Phaedon cochleariae]